MFVSSYNTYLAHKPSIKTQENTQKKEDTNPFSSEKQLFSSALEKVVTSSVKIPLNYISNYKSLNNKQLLQQQNQLNKDYSKIKFSKINKMKSAQNAYSENSKLFSFLQKPKIALEQEPKIPQNIKQSSTIKQRFINTYIANDNYYKVTAA
jgi:hypothetical protein